MYKIIFFSVLTFVSISTLHAESALDAPAFPEMDLPAHDVTPVSPVVQEEPESTPVPKKLPRKLKPGQFIWNTPTTKPTLAKISISEQKMYLYQDQTLIGVSTVSTGRRRHRTPTGSFRVLAKTRYHRSKKYNNAPMPYSQWLTSQGVAMHAGKLPGYPASHGCIRLPKRFAKLLFETTSVGMPVVISQ